MDASSPRLKLNNRLLPVLVVLLAIMQLVVPFRGWTILLVGLGGGWLVSYLWAWSLAHNLQLKRETRFGWAQVGDRLEERFTLINHGWVPALWVEILDHSTMPGYQISRVTGVGGNAENRWQTHGFCERRGLFTLGPTSLQTGDPFGLYTVNLHYPNLETLTVTPPVVPLPTIQVAPGGRIGNGHFEFVMQCQLVSKRVPQVVVVIHDEYFADIAHKVVAPESTWIGQIGYLPRVD